MASGKIGELDRVHRALFNAFAAAYAFVVIYHGEVVHDSDRAMLAVAHTETASDTA